MVYAQPQDDRGLFVAANGFTTGAREVAEEHRIELWDGPALTGLVQTYAPEDPRSAQETSTSRSEFCTECGEAVRGEDSYCHHCGASLRLDP